jgi:hypothetical protein
MTHAYTKAELRNIADAMADDDVLLGDTWDREHFNYAHQVILTPQLWREFIEFYSEYYGLEDLNDDLHVFMSRRGLQHEEAPRPPDDC